MNSFKKMYLIVILLLSSNAVLAATYTYEVDLNDVPPYSVSGSYWVFAFQADSGITLEVGDILTVSVGSNTVSYMIDADGNPVQIATGQIMMGGGEGGTGSSGGGATSWTVNSSPVIDPCDYIKCKVTITGGVGQ